MHVELGVLDQRVVVPYEDREPLPFSKSIIYMKLLIPYIQI